MVLAEVATLPKSRMVVLKLKLFLYPLLFILIYILALKNADHTFIFLIGYILLGLLTVIMFIALIHELAHNSIFKTSKHNRMALYLFDLLGANSYIWRQRHIKLHHLYPNVNGWDADIEQKGPLTIFPNEQQHRNTRYQHKYVFFLYPLFMLNWLLIRDFKDFFSKDRIIKKVVDIPRIEFVKLVLFKSFYFFMIVALPVLLFHVPLWKALLGLLVLTMAGSLLAMVILLTPHVNVDNEFPRLETGNQLNTSWFRHQLQTANDISNYNWWTRNVMANFNFHLIHHLFPNISHVYAPEATEVLIQFCREHGLSYKSYPISRSLKKHYQLIKNNAIGFSELDL